MPGRNALSFLFKEERAFHPPGLATLLLRAPDLRPSRASSEASPLGNVTNRLPPFDGDPNLRRFAFRQHDPGLSERRTEEAFAGGS